MAKYHQFLVYVETDANGHITPLSLETLKAAKEAALDKRIGVSALVVGADVSKAAQELQFHNVDAVYIKEGAGFIHYQPRLFLAVIEKAYGLLAPELILFGNSKNALDLAARTAVSLNAALVTDCVEIKGNSDEFLFVKPVYSNNVMAVYAGDSSLCILTMRSKSTHPSERSEVKNGDIIHLDDLDEPVVEEYEVVEKGAIEDGGKKLVDAEIIVTGGRGIGGPAGFKELKTLADLLGGQVGATRPPCDLGWIGPGAQVGITGAIVSPEVYFAIGVSGSFQHMAGMGGSRTVIAVNTDSNATIFKISDYGVVGEYEEVIPGFIDEISRR
jgi:electron transfer flavoprotein alpha subunit